MSLLHVGVLLQAVIACCFLWPRIRAHEHEVMAKAVIFRAKNFSRNSRDVTYLGTLDLLQKADSDEVMITGELFQLDNGLHGMHVHEKGDVSSSCLFSGTHYNPHDKHHGGLNNETRHVGDLGNIEVTGRNANINITDKMIQLNGKQSIIGRAIVIHENEDDLGTADTNESKTTGSSGRPIACGIVAIANPDYEHAGARHSMASLALVLLQLSFGFLFMRKH